MGTNVFKIGDVVIEQTYFWWYRAHELELDTRGMRPWGKEYT